MREFNFLKSLLLIISVHLGVSGFAQTSIQANDLSNNWTLMTTENGVEIYIKENKCDVGADDLFTYAFVRFVNTTEASKDVEYNFELYFDNGCIGCGDVTESRFSVTLPANQTLDGDCDHSNMSLLINNPYQLDSGKLESIKLVQLKIN